MTDFRAMVGRAAALQKMGRLDQAETLYRQLVAAEPRNSVALHMLGILLAQSGRASEALEMIDASLAISPKDSVALENRGKILFSERRLSEALASLDRALAADPGNANARLSRGIVLQEMGRLPDALRELEYCASRHPQDARVLREYANMLNSVGQTEAALQVYDLALKVAPRSVEFLNNRGGLLRSLRRYQEALESYDLALKEMPDLLESLSNKGAVLVDLGRPKEALQIYDAVLARQPRSAAIWNNLGFVQRKLGRHGEALASFQQALSIDPTHIPAINNTAKTLCDMGETARAFQSFLVAARLERSRMARLPGGAVVVDEAFHKEQLGYLSEYAPELQRAFAGGGLTLAGGASVRGNAIRPFEQPDKIARAWRDGCPRLLVIDDLLTDEALAALRHFCLGSNIWTRKYPGGYWGAFPEAGFACELLAQIAEEFRSRLSFAIGSHRLKYLWAFSYEAQAPGTSVHADEAAVNINFWITPTGANRNPETGGLVVWDKAAPADWNFDKFNNDPAAIEAYLERTAATPTKVPYRQNRAVIFASGLFHKTDSVDFAPGYDQRRINITMLFGERGA